jgi:glycosyltransferase involved in cell wall biosynthesis
LALKRWQRQVEAHGVDIYYVYASREIAAYSRTFGIAERKFRFIPFHHTLNRSSPAIRDEGYVFAGGNYGRDYDLFFRSVEGLPYRVEVACTRREALRGLTLPANVQVAGYSHEAYLEKMAGCRVNVVPLAEGDLHSGGQQTLLNSMALGKATVVTDPAGARDYIEDGRNGVLTPAGDADALRAAIVELMENHVGRAAMEIRAGTVRDTHSTDAFFRNLIAMLGEDLGITYD